MPLSHQSWARWLAGFAFFASLAGFVSIAVSHACLAVALLLLLIRPSSIRAPRPMWLIGAFVLWTLISVAGSADPSAAFPQIKKFFVFAMLPAIFTAMTTVERARKLAEAWFVVVAIAAGLAVVQFVQKFFTITAAGNDFYTYYVNDRITGFFGHWMTFSQAGLLVFVTLISYLMFGKHRPGTAVWWPLAGVIGLGLVLAYSRGVWLALVVAAIYFALVWKPRLLLLGPIVAVVGFLLAPDSLQQRITSINPASNANRIIMWRTGLRMIQTYPVLGVGPEQVGPRFSEFQPPDITELPDAYYAHLHNVYIHYAAERGIPAALIIIVMLALAIWDCRAALARLPVVPGDRRFLLHAGIAGTLCVLVVSCFDVSLGDSEVLGAYLGLMAIAYRAVTETKA